MQALIALLVEHGLLLVFTATLAARVGMPVPAAPLLIVAGGLSVTGALSLPAVLLAATLANVLGDGVWFAAGRRYGARVLGLLCRISMSPDSCVRQSESLIGRWGGSSLIAAKFVPGVSVVAAPMVGAMGMSWRRFVGHDLLAGAIWSAVFLGLGFAFADQVQTVLDVLADAGLAATALLLLGVAGFVAWRYLRRRRFLRKVAMARITVDELHAAMARGEAPVVLDVRAATVTELDRRRIPGAMLVALPSLPDQVAHLPRDRELVTYCDCPNEASAALAAHELRKAGFTRVRPLTGGLEAWVASGRAVSLGD